MTTLTRLYPGVMLALKHFRKVGIPLGICTNKPTGPAKEICARLDLIQFFDVITGAETGQPKKPDPTSLLVSISALGVSSVDVLYVGDSAIDFFTALNGSVPFRLFANGYLNEPLPDLSKADRFEDWGSHGILVD
jgi:phosphoglycolate phosphatase